MQDQRLDAVLVLRVQGGNDIFCSLSGRYLPSFFGVAPATLASLPRCAACAGCLLCPCSGCAPISMHELSWDSSCSQDCEWQPWLQLHKALAPRLGVVRREPAPSVGLQMHPHGTVTHASVGTLKPT